MRKKSFVTVRNVSKIFAMFKLTGKAVRIKQANSFCRKVPYFVTLDDRQRLSSQFFY